MSLLRNTLIVGGIASLATSVASVIFCKAEKKPAAAGLNAVSHIAWDKEAFHVDRVNVKHTLVGTALNAAAITSWAFLMELVMPKRKRNLAEALAKGAGVAATAYVVDYHVVPKRLTPGFEERLSKKALFGMYAVLAVALAVGSVNRER